MYKISDKSSLLACSDYFFFAGTNEDWCSLQMLLREITVMDACSHPHLVRLYEVQITSHCH